jgi:NAD(P)-dependent dehydrogenase (short-subunit alcohol dehydrogenase family)
VPAFLKDHVCLVTGGAQGIGWAIAQALAKYGGQVYVCDISEENLEAAASRLRESSRNDAISLAWCDVSDRERMEAWIAGIYEETGRIDLLVNNAAFVSWERVADMPVEDAIRTMRVGYDGMVYGINAVLPLMQAAGRGHIVNMGSSAGRIFVSGPSAAYAAVKAAIDGYTQMLQVELRDSPVGVTLVRLGTVGGTDFFRKHVPSSYLPRLADFVPYLTPPQVAAGVVKAVRNGWPFLNMPRTLPLFMLFFEVAPRLFRWVGRAPGGALNEYGNVAWEK